MLNVITITTDRNVNNDGEEYTLTTHTVGGYTLVRKEFPALDHVAWKVRAPHDLPTITDMSNFDAEIPVFGVNWSACGTQHSAGARTYGSLIVFAADVADVFNRIVANGQTTPANYPRLL